MSSLNETPSSGRVHIAFFGLRNAGKSTLVNAFTNQNIAIVSDVAGTTTDPVSKAMEILPLGPCLITDTAGLDDVGELGALRVEKTLKVLETTDVAVWVGEGRTAEFDAKCRARKVTVLDYHRGDSVEELKRKIASLNLVDETPGLLEGLVDPEDVHVVLVCPIDESAPKGRLILPQVQVIRDCLDRHLACTVCQVEELDGVLRASCSVHHDTLVITDSQAFKDVSSVVGARARLTSFSILFARQKGDLAAYKAGLKALQSLKDGDRVLIAEGCTHHRQCNDIGAVKIPKALKKLTGKDLKFEFSSGTGFPLSPTPSPTPTFSLIVQCGGCMLTRREVLRRIRLAEAAGIPIVNYGMLLATAAGVEVEKCVM